MKRFTTTLLLLFLTCGMIYAEEEITFTLDSTFNSAYIWRGITVVDDFVWQPMIVADISGFSFSIWGNMDLTDINDYPEGNGEFKITEIDYVAEYSGVYENITYMIGIGHFSFPNTGWNGVTELKFSLGLDTVLAPTVTVNQDIDQVEGTYTTFSLGHSVSLDDGYSIDLGVAMGFGTDKHNIYYYGVEETVITDLLFTAAMPIDINDNFVITPLFSFSTILDDEISDSMENPDNHSFGISLTYTN